MRHLLELMEYVERHSLDPRLYWFLPEDLESGAPAIEVKYQMTDDKGWYYKFKSQEIWLYCEKEALLSQLRWHKVDLMLMVKEVEQSITQQIVYTRMIYREASDLIGGERLEKAIGTHEQFLEELSFAIRGMFQESEAQKASHLRIVHSDETIFLN